MLPNPTTGGCPKRRSRHHKLVSERSVGYFTFESRAAGKNSGSARYWLSCYCPNTCATTVFHPDNLKVPTSTLLPAVERQQLLRGALSAHAALPIQHACALQAAPKCNQVNTAFNATVQQLAHPANRMTQTPMRPRLSCAEIHDLVLHTRVDIHLRTNAQRDEPVTTTVSHLQRVGAGTSLP